MSSERLFPLPSSTSASSQRQPSPFDTSILSHSVGLASPALMMLHIGAEQKQAVISGIYGTLAEDSKSIRTSNPWLLAQKVWLPQVGIHLVSRT